MGETFHEKIAEMEKNIISKIENLEKQRTLQEDVNNRVIDMLTLLRTGQTSNYVDTLGEEYRRSKYFSNKHIEGKEVPTKEYNDTIQWKTCHKSDTVYPHLYHTYHPQLNCMIDMIKDIQDFLFGTIGKDIINDLDKATTLLFDYVKEITSEKRPEANSWAEELKKINDIISELKDITKRQLDKKPITIEDLEKHFHQKMEITPSQSETPDRPPRTNLRFASPSIFTGIGYNG